MSERKARLVSFSFQGNIAVPCYFFILFRGHEMSYKFFMFWYYLLSFLQNYMFIAAWKNGPCMNEWRCISYKHPATWETQCFTWICFLLVLFTGLRSHGILHHWTHHHLVENICCFNTLSKVYRHCALKIAGKNDSRIYINPPWN